MSLKIGKKHLEIMPAPGHSEDGIAILVVEDRVLFAGDSFMPIPYLLDGNPDDLRGFYEEVRGMTLENIVQGHGEVILRGEVEPTIDDNLAYIAVVEKIAQTALRRKEPMEYLSKQDVEKCGKSRILLGGLAATLHEQNLQHAYQKALAEQEAESG
jgi:glyoxylase-like metal-dependent hydrolase (beta-lactamase superfamily II)